MKRTLTLLFVAALFVIGYAQDELFNMRGGISTGIGVTDLKYLTDVYPLGTQAAGDLLEYSGTKWTNVTHITSATTTYTNVIGGTATRIPFFAAGTPTRLTEDSALLYDTGNNRFKTQAISSWGTAGGDNLEIEAYDVDGGSYVVWIDIVNSNDPYMLIRPFTVGRGGVDGYINLYSEQGTTDYTLQLNPNAAMTSDTVLYGPADEPTFEAWLTMGTDGIIDYTEIATETLDVVAGRGATTDVALVLEANATLGKNGAGGTEGKIVLRDGLNPGTTTDWDYTLATYVDQDVTADANPSFATANIVGTNSLNLGTASTNTGQIVLKNGTNANTLTLQPGATGASISLTLPLDDGDANDVLISNGSGTLDWVATSTLEADTLATVTARGATTAVSSAFTGAVPQVVLGEDIAGGTPNTPGQVKMFSSGDDAYYATLAAGALTSNAAYILPVDEPAGTYLLNMTTGGQIGYDASAYLTAEVDGDTTNEINTITGDDSNTTSGLAITLAGAGIAATAVAGDTVTITATEAQDLAAVTAIGATTTVDLTMGSIDLGTASVTEHLTAHNAGTVILKDLGDNTTVTIGPVTDGTDDLTITGDVNVTGTLTGKIMMPTWDTDADLTLTEAQCLGGYALHDHDSSATANVSVVTRGKVITVGASDLFAIGKVLTVNPDDADYIVLSGVKGSAGQAIASDGTGLAPTLSMAGVDDERWNVVGTPVGGWAFVP